MNVKTPGFILDFIDSLDRMTRSKAIELLDTLRMSDYQIVFSYSKKIDMELFELKIRSAKQVRLLYTYHNGSILVLHIFVKKTWKIPLQELDTARQRLKVLRNI